MTTKTKIHRTMLTLTAITALSAIACEDPPEVSAALEDLSPVERGLYLVTVGGCHDCHTPWVPTHDGAAPDMTRALSGHPADLEMPPAPAAQGPWMISLAGTNTAYSGPWGTSFTANLTPDDETGLGTWDTQTFIDTIRNGRHMGRGRPLLPPMPAQNYAQMTDEDLAAVFAYLQSIPPVRNRVPTPRPPAVASL